MKKIRLLFFVLAMALILSVTAFANETEGRDFAFENSLASDLKALGLFSGVSDNDFDLERAPSRVEVLVMLIRVLGEEKAALEGEFSHPFTDVPAWADKYVGYAYENGLTKGISKTKFGNDTASAATYLTFMLRALGYSDSKGDFKWDAPYDFAFGLGMLPSCVDTENFLRADIVTVSYAALSVELKNTTTLLCEKLVEKEVFTSELLSKNYTASKITDKENESKAVFAAEDIYADCSPAVFYIEIQTADGTPLASGSGFFIDESGIAITNHHVMDGAEKAVVTLSGSGAKYDVTGLYYYSLEHDVAVIQVDGSGFETLDINPFPVKGASTVYAIGSPRGLQNTISQGIISNVRRVLNGESYIQTTAAISNGSSGGVLLNVYGEAIGITSAGIDAGQNLNFARPITYIAPAIKDGATPLADVNWNYARYELDEESYTLCAGEKLTFEFDVISYTTDGVLPKCKAESDNPDVCAVASAYGDTFVNLVAVAPGTAKITISDDKTDNSATFTVTVTEGVERERPFVEYFATVDEIGLNKGATSTLLISAVTVGAENSDDWKVVSKNTTVAKVSNVTVEDGYISVDVTALKNGSTELSVKCGDIGEEFIIPVKVGEQFYTAFNTLKTYALENGEFNDAENDEDDCYVVDGRIYSSGDAVSLVYYPTKDEVHLRTESTAVVEMKIDVILSRESESTGKKVEVEIDFSLIEFYARGDIANPATFGDGRSDKLSFDEYEGPEGMQKEYEASMARSVILILYEFDQWLRYITPGIDATDFGFVAIDYEYYGVNFFN